MEKLSQDTILVTWQEHREQKKSKIPPKTIKSIFCKEYDILIILRPIFLWLLQNMS